jgi:hypothetical protein
MYRATSAHSNHRNFLNSSTGVDDPLALPLVRWKKPTTMQANYIVVPYRYEEIYSGSQLFFQGLRGNIII